MFSNRNLSHLHDVSGLGAFIFVCMKGKKTIINRSFQGAHF